MAKLNTSCSPSRFYAISWKWRTWKDSITAPPLPRISLTPLPTAPLSLDAPVESCPAGSPSVAPQKLSFLLAFSLQDGLSPFALFHRAEPIAQWLPAFTQHPLHSNQLFISALPLFGVSRQCGTTLRRSISAKKSWRI